MGETLLLSSVTRKKSPNVYKSCPKRKVPRCIRWAVFSSRHQRYDQCLAISNCNTNLWNELTTLIFCPINYDFTVVIYKRKMCIYCPQRSEVRIESWWKFLNTYLQHFFLSTVMKRQEIKKKRPRSAQLKTIYICRKPQNTQGTEAFSDLCISCSVTRWFYFSAQYLDICDN